MNDERIFVDTNILVYSHDIDAGEKHERAKELILQLWNQERLPSISIQVLQELYVTLVRRSVPLKNAQATVLDYLLWNVVENSKTIFTEALKIEQRYKISFWDASIVAAAQKADAVTIYSEDLNDGQTFGAVTVRNPFAD